jgi:DNA-binding MarR family transcriptional regulator
VVRIQQQNFTGRLGLTQSVVSRAIGQLQDKGIIERQCRGTVLIHPLLAG